MLIFVFELYALELIYLLINVVYLCAKL